MKKLIISTFAVVVALAAVTAQAGRLGYQGENPINTTQGTSMSTTGRYGYPGENPTTNPNWKKEQAEKRRMQQEDRQRTRATTSRGMYRTMGQ